MNNNPSNKAPENRSKEKRAKWPVVFLALLLLAAGGYAVYRYAVAGWLTTSVTIESVEVYDDSVMLVGELNGFAGLKDCSYTVDEDIVVIELLCTWPVFGREKEFTVIIEDDFSGVLEVDISDGRNQLVVWGEE